MDTIDNIIVRPARKEDEPYIREFTTHTFDWGDYVADAISGWVDEDAKGQGNVYVAVVEGRPVAVTHVSYMSQDEAWFEGIRVHPDFRRMGIGRMLTIASIEGARRHGMKVCRAAIDADNEKSMRLATSLGFRPVASIVQFEIDIASLNDDRSDTGESHVTDGTVRGPSAGASPLLSPVRIRTAAPDDATALHQAVAREMAYVGSDFYWSYVSPVNVQRMVAAGKFRIALDASGDLVAGVAVSDTFVDSVSKHPVVYGELSSVFGDISGILALAQDCATAVEKEAAGRGLPAKLVLTCENGSSAAHILPQHGFTARYIEGRLDEVRLWELPVEG